MIHINVQLLDRGEVAMSNKLETYRQEIVSLNDQILELLSRRGELAQKLVKKKIKQGTRVYDPQREKK